MWILPTKTFYGKLTFLQKRFLEKIKQSAIYVIVPSVASASVTSAIFSTTDLQISSANLCGIVWIFAVRTIESISRKRLLWSLAKLRSNGSSSSGFLVKKDFVNSNSITVPESVETDAVLGIFSKNA